LVGTSRRWYFGAALALAFRHFLIVLRDRLASLAIWLMLLHRADASRESCPAEPW
jgi:hypothetical protein